MARVQGVYARFASNAACVVALAALAAGCNGDRCKAGPVEAGQVCPTVGTGACQGHNVFTCTAPADGQRCPVWAPSVDCATRDPGPLTCGTAGGAAACQCPAPTGDELRVDPAEGGEAGRGLHATGAASPPACRFRRLGDGVRAATRPGMRVAVASDPARLPVTMTGEPFPLRIGRGVTVAAQGADQYRLIFDAPAEPAAVTLAADAALEGLAISAGGGNPAATAITCSGGPVALRSIRLAGAGAGDGTQRMGTGLAIGSSDAGGCAAVVSRLEVAGFGVGITVNSSAREPSTLDDVIVRDVTTAGLVVNAGTAKVNQLTVEKPAAGAAAFGVLVDGLSALNPAVLDGSVFIIDDTQQPALEVRAAAMAAAPQVSVTGAQIRRAGAAGLPGLRQLAGTMVLYGVSVTGSGSHGLRLMGGVATLTDVRFEKNADDGVRMEGGTLVMSAYVASQNGADGVEISGGQAQLEKGAAENNTARGLYVWGGMVSIGGPLSVMNNGRGPERATGLRFERGNLVVKGTPAGPIEIGNNGLHGINIEGPGPAGSVAISGVTVWGSGEYGVNIDLTSPGGHALVADLEAHHNGYGGVVIRRAPSREVDGLVLRGLAVHENGTEQVGAGIWVRGDLGPTLATISGSTIEGNSDCGLRVSQGPGLRTELGLRDNLVRGNNTAGRRTTGGIFFETAATLTSFTGNRVLANRGDQIGFAAPANGGVPWRLGPSSADCTMPTAFNQISCYVGATGVSLAGDVAIEVDATGVSWQSPDPTPGRDYVAGTQGRVITTAPCPPVMTTCP